jgi:hypothetical protein
MASQRDQTPARYSRTGKLKSGQQAGSKRPPSRTGMAGPARKKGDRPVKGTLRPGAPRKTAPEK